MLAPQEADSYNFRTMSQAKNQISEVSLLPLWTKLIEELAGVFDTHFVCATIASEVAAFSNLTTVVGVSSLQRDFYDVWICQPDRSLTQMRWQEEASFSLIINSHQATHLEKLSRPVTDLINSEMWLLANDNILAVPLPFSMDNSETAKSGLLILIDPKEDNKLGEAELEYLARGMSVYLDRAELRRQVDQQEVEFTVVSDISHVLTSTLSMERVFQELKGTIRRILQVESLSVGLTEPNTGDVVFIQSLMGVPSENLPAIRLKPGQGIAGWVSMHGKAVIINDVYADHRFDPDPDRRSGFRTRSMICIPLQVEKRTIGVLQAINRRYGQFTTRDLNLLQAIAAPLAATIENSTLHADVLSEKRRMETILASMFDGLLAVSSAGHITRVNDAFIALSMADETQLVGEKINALVALQTDSISSLINEIFHRKEKSVQIASELQRPDGEVIPVLISGAPIIDKNGRVNEAILTFSDLSQIREVERMRDDLFQTIAHELRTPLATILMYARLLLEGKAQDEEKAARFLRVIERESDRLQYMVYRMMQLAKQGARELHHSPEPINLNPILDDILPQFADQAVQKGLYFRQKVEEDLPPILGNEERFEEIIGNLIGNAIKFSQSGTIKLEVRKMEDHIKIEVVDQGIGIPKQALPYLFNRFYRAQSAVDRGIAGTGLGLYMVKQSVEQYNGSINVSSKEGEGSTFTVLFPIYEDYA
jgi:two-component system, OmpR family, phosphate regulon sensor histidine kinase PhoR